MTSRKNRPVLYEVFRRRQSASGGSWFPRSPSVAREAPPPTVEAPRASVPAPRPQRVSTDETGERSRVELREGRVFANLSYPVAAVCAAILLALLIMGFEIGRRMGAPAPTTDEFTLEETSVADRSATAPPTSPPTSDRDVSLPPRSDGTEPIVKKPDSPKAAIGDTEISRDGKSSAPEEEAAPKIEMKPGYSYVQVQVFPKRNADDARKSAQFLTGKGVPCCILRRKDDIVLYASQAFHTTQKDVAARKREQQAADELARRIKDLGKEFAKTGGGYRFEWAKPEEMK